MRHWQRRNMSSAELPQRDKMFCYSQGLWPQEGWVFIYKSSPRHPRAAVFGRDPLPNRIKAKVGRAQGKLRLKVKDRAPCCPGAIYLSFSLIHAALGNACCQLPQGPICWSFPTAWSTGLKPSLSVSHGLCKEWDSFGFSWNVLQSYLCLPLSWVP